MQHYIQVSFERSEVTISLSQPDNRARVVKYLYYALTLLSKQIEGTYNELTFTVEKEKRE